MRHVHNIVEQHTPLNAQPNLTSQPFAVESLAL